MKRLSKITGTSNWIINIILLQLMALAAIGIVGATYNLIKMIVQ